MGRCALAAPPAIGRLDALGIQEMRRFWPRNQEETGGEVGGGDFFMKIRRETWMEGRWLSSARSTALRFIYGCADLGWRTAVRDRGFSIFSVLVGKILGRLSKGSGIFI